MAITKQSGWLNQKELAASAGVAPRTLRDWNLKPVGKIGNSNYYLVADLVEYKLKQQLKLLKKESSIEGDEQSLEYHERRLTKERADNLELKNCQIRSELIPIDLLSDIVATVGPAAAALIDTIPQAVKRKFPKIEPAVLDFIKWQCVKIQNNIAKIDDHIEPVIEAYIDQLESA